MKPKTESHHSEADGRKCHRSTRGAGAAARLALLVAGPGRGCPFLPRHLALAALLTIGVPSLVLALAPSDGPLYRGHLLKSLAAFAVPAGVATATVEGKATLHCFGGCAGGAGVSGGGIGVMDRGQGNWLEAARDAKA